MAEAFHQYLLPKMIPLTKNRHTAPSVSPRSAAVIDAAKRLSQSLFKTFRSLRHRSCRPNPAPVVSSGEYRSQCGT